MPKLKRVFYAFPNQPAALAETINNALRMLRMDPDIRRDNVRFTPWTDLTTGGKQLVATILSNIDRSDVFACDLTYVNSNVAFELGYAIGRFKRIWISLNTSTDGAEQRYRRTFFGMLGSAYVPYNNSYELSEAFLNDNPILDPDRTLLGTLYRNPMARQETPAIFYVKPSINTEAVVTAAETLSESVFGNSLIVDDPIENPSPTLEWYARQLSVADAVLCHLLGNDQVGQTAHNTKCSIVAGMSVGLNKSMLMLAQTPFVSPIDYQAHLKLHETAKECKVAITDWITTLGPAISPRRRRRSKDRTKRGGEANLRSLTIGEPVAENERQRLDDYFVETSTYLRAMEDPVTIVVGRKGSGKSAQLYAMQATLSGDKRNHVCVIKPVGYEIDGLVRVLNAIMDKSERGYLIESLWKYLIYSELARSTHTVLDSRSPYETQSEAELRFIDYYNDNADLLTRPFSERLDMAVSKLSGIAETTNSLTQRSRISELLHANELLQLRDVLGGALSGYSKVCILVDNLDAPWGPNTHVDQLSELLWGLLLVSSDIVNDFLKKDHWRTAVEVNLTVFLRSDIFAYVQPTASEQDKLPIQRIIWDDPGTLRQIIDQRLLQGAPIGQDASKIWSQVFPSEVVSMPTWDFAMSTVLPRPRDIVYLMREVLDGAINHGQLTVSPENFLNAREKYSEFAFRSILAEDDPRKGRLEAILYEFAGCPKQITRSQIEARFKSADVKANDVEFYIDLLCDVNFLAIPSYNEYVYAKDESDRRMKRRIAAKISENNGEEESFEVSSAFWHVLQVE